MYSWIQFLIMEDQLLQNFLDKKKGADEALFKYCFSFLWTTCRTYSLDDQEAMAFLNFGFYKILSGLPKKKPSVPFVFWAKRVTINSIIDEKRKNYKYQTQELTPNYDALEHANPMVINVFAEEDCEYILQIIRGLPKTSALVFSLFAVDEFSYEEIATKLNITENTVRWHIADARKKIIQRLSLSNSTTYGNAR
jgi:RNA polymerase sigma factor (sigma-70 family)